MSEFEEDEDEVRDEDDTPSSEVPDEELHVDVAELRQVYNQVRQLHHDWYLHLANLVEKIKKRQYSNEEMADLGFLLRNCEDLLKDSKTEFMAKKDLVGKILAALVTMEAESINSDNVSPTIHGKLASATADLKVRAKMPKFGTPAYVSMMKFFGVDDKAIELGVMAPHYIRVGDYLTERAKNSENPPKGIIETVTFFKCVFRKRRVR